MVEDPNIITAGLTAAKLGFDTMRAVFGLLKDAKEALPKGDKATAVGVAIEQSERQFGIAEAQIAQALGYQLCKCEFPPTIMLTVGSLSPRGGERQGGPVYECPKCSFNTAYPYNFTRLRGTPSSYPQPSS